MLIKYTVYLECTVSCLFNASGKFKTPANSINVKADFAYLMWILQTVGNGLCINFTLSIKRNLIFSDIMSHTTELQGAYL